MSAALKIGPGPLTAEEFTRWDSGDWSGALRQLVVHSTKVEAELLRRAGSDRPADAETIGPEDVLRLDSIGFAAPLTDVCRTSGLLQDERRQQGVQAEPPRGRRAQAPAAAL